MNKEIENYNLNQTLNEAQICNKLSQIIDERFIGSIDSATSKIWHAHPVWFINENPIVGYSKQKHGIRLMFWSGQDFDDSVLNVRGGKFKDASIFYNDISEINIDQINIWLDKSVLIQWDYKNIVKRKGQLLRL